jgi:hypothetical protein
MVKNSKKIILIDADVVSHFIYASELLNIAKIFPRNKIKILDKVYAELERWPSKKKEVNNLVEFQILEVINFPDDPEISKEYFHLKKILFKGDGESACLAVARFSENIVSSSNLRDIKPYCELHGVLYLTTMDFLCRALRDNVFDLKRCNDFISNVLAKKGRLPVKKMSEHTCRTIDFI